MSIAYYLLQLFGEINFINNTGPGLQVYTWNVLISLGGYGYTLGQLTHPYACEFPSQVHILVSYISSYLPV